MSPPTVVVDARRPGRIRHSVVLAVTMAMFPVLAARAEDGPASINSSADNAAADSPGAVNHCAKSPKLLGANCAYTTGLMAGRVLAEGQDWRFNGRITPGSNDLESRVACPYVVADAQVVANELLEALVDSGGDAGRLQLRGKTLEVDGIRYVVLTSWSVLES